MYPKEQTGKIHSCHRVLPTGAWKLSNHSAYKLTPPLWQDKPKRRAWWDSNHRFYKNVSFSPELFYIREKSKMPHTTSLPFVNASKTCDRDNNALRNKIIILLPIHSNWVWTGKLNFVSASLGIFPGSVSWWAACWTGAKWCTRNLSPIPMTETVILLHWMIAISILLSWTEKPNLVSTASENIRYILPGC